jgi:hypothetical protein
MCTLGWGRRFGREPLFEQLAARYTVPATTESEEELKARGLKARAAAAGTAASTARAARASACSPLPRVAGMAFQSGARSLYVCSRRRMFDWQFDWRRLYQQLGIAQDLAAQPAVADVVNALGKDVFLDEEEDEDGERPVALCKAQLWNMLRWGHGSGSLAERLQRGLGAGDVSARFERWHEAAFRFEGIDAAMARLLAWAYGAGPLELDATGRRTSVAGAKPPEWLGDVVAMVAESARASAAVSFPCAQTRTHGHEHAMCVACVCACECV